MKTILDHLMDSPQAFLIIEEALAILHNEKQKRQNFYNEVNEQEKVEFIQGEIIVHSPVVKKHNRISGLLYRLLSFYVDEQNLGFVGIEKIMISLTRNDYEPDICFFGQEKARHFKENQSLFPAPDFIVEVLSPSTEARDRGIKFQDYAAHGVSEYWMIDPETEFVEQYFLDRQSYHLQLKAKEGHIRSLAVRDFQIPIAAIFSKEMNFKTLTALMAKN